MKKIREITSEKENFRVERGFIKRDPVKPVPEGTIILMAFRITGYDRDCDGSLMARTEHIDFNGETSGMKLNGFGLYPDSELIVTQEELTQLMKNAEEE